MKKKTTSWLDVVNLAEFSHDILSLGYLGKDSAKLPVVRPLAVSHQRSPLNPDF
ncbi:hypothetical protein [Planktothricoides raciborskii]|uniref:Uncharacterized protein n=1 Tax=Planktothricoides raciborskii GIHE-MW2 TaxID=2792601 RepID=A0AAU8JBH4_9CYAN|nr:hypothetical protein [Planktothricoides raciborskii]